MSMTANYDKEEVLEEREMTPLERVGLPATQEEVVMKQEDLIRGLLEAAESKYSDDEQKEIHIKRGGKLLFSFKIRPLSEDELMRIRKTSTPTYKNPQGRNAPRLEGELRYGEFRSKKIYTATVEDEKTGERIWDNTQLKRSLNAKGFDIQEAWEIIDKVLLAGEKDKVADLIDEISGYDADLTEYAKN